MEDKPIEKAITLIRQGNDAGTHKKQSNFGLFIIGHEIYLPRA